MIDTKPPAVPSAVVLNMLPHPIMTLDAQGRVIGANAACEAFFHLSAGQLLRSSLAELLPFGSPVLSVVEDARRRRCVINEYRIDVGTPRIGLERIVDVNAIPLLPDAQNVVIMLQERTIADKMDRQLTHMHGSEQSLGCIHQLQGHKCMMKPCCVAPNAHIVQALVLSTTTNLASPVQCLAATMGAAG